MIRGWTWIVRDSRLDLPHVQRSLQPQKLYVYVPTVRVSRAVGWLVGGSLGRREEKRRFHGWMSEKRRRGGGGGKKRRRRQQMKKRFLLLSFPPSLAQLANGTTRADYRGEKWHRRERNDHSQHLASRAICFALFRLYFGRNLTRVVSGSI